MPPPPADPRDLARRLLAGPRAPEIPAGAALAGAVLRVGLDLLDEVDAAAEELPPASGRAMADPGDLALLRPGDRLLFGSWEVASDLSDVAASSVSCALWEARDFRDHVADLTGPGLRRAAVESLACNLDGIPQLEALAERAADWPVQKPRSGRPPRWILRPAGSPREACRRVKQARALLRAARALLAAAGAGAGAGAREGRLP